MPKKKQRRLVSIMFTDIVGYSRIMQDNEQSGIAVRNRHRSVFKEMTEKYEGELLQYFGDGTLSIFNSSTEAVECAIQMQRAFQKDPKVPLRIGIHTGEIIFNEHDAFGHGINVAARIEPICIPGGVYITGKVKEDITNHPWIETQPQGLYELKNIHEAVEIYAVTNEGINAPAQPGIRKPVSKFRKTENILGIKNQIVGNKKKWITALLAFFFGIFGMHRFYLGQRTLGIFYFASFLLGIIGGDAAWMFIVIPALVGFIDSITFASMSKKDFDLKYNVDKISGKEEDQDVYEEVKEEYSEDWIQEQLDEEIKSMPLPDRAARAVRLGKYQEAIDFYHELLEKDSTNRQIHFSLAVCYSMNQDAKNGFYHLSKAVEYGYNDFQKIRNHFTLAYLRSRKEFKAFEQQGFRLVSMLPSPQEDLLDTETPLLLKKLEKLELLGDKLEKGEITDLEFKVKKKEILNS